MFLLVIILSYVLGCVSTVALLIYLYVNSGFNSPVKVIEQEQYQTFRPLPENDRAKNSAVDAVNYLFQFLFQEMKDSSKLRRYVMRKLIVEFNELKNSRIGKLFLQDIVIQSFSIGKECPILSDIQLERQERDERQLIKEFVAKLNADYKGGFSVTLDITLVFGYKCQLFIKVKRIQGNLHLEFRREPFSHWLFAFQDEPFIDFEIKSYLSTRESPHLAYIILQQIRRAIQRKQTWPNYKIRYQPFFPTSKRELPTEVLTNNNKNIIPGIFNILIKHCDRLCIPFEIFNKEKSSLLSIFLTINIDEQMCQDYLHIHRNQWTRKQFELILPIHKISLKEVLYMNHMEFLIEELDPIPNDIEDIELFKIALEEKNIFLLQIQGYDVKSMKQAKRLLKYKSLNDEKNKIQIVVGMPLLHSVRVQRVNETSNTITTESAINYLEKLPVSKQKDDNNVQPKNSIEQRKNSSDNDITLIMINADDLQELPGRQTSTQKAESYVELNHKFEFQVGPNERFLNVYLWCKPPPDCDIPNAEKQIILLGYATIALSEIVLDAHMNYRRETQTTVNFRSVNSSKSDLNACLTNSESKKRVELSRHKAYDDNMSHGFVTINIKHEPEIEKKLIVEEKKEPIIIVSETIIFDKTKDDDEKKKEELKLLNQEQESALRRPTDHVFEDYTFTVGTLCACCNKKIWMKSGRQCLDCLATVHKKCEEKFSLENICTHEPIQPKSTISDDSISMKSIDDNESILSTNQTTTAGYFLSTKAAAAFSAIDSTARRSFRVFGEKNVNQTPNLTQSQLMKIDESVNNILSTNSSPGTEKRSLSNSSIQTSSKLANVASSAYSKLREFKTKRLLPSSTPEIKTTRSPSDSTRSENISESDLQDIITSCLSDENIDIKNLEHLLHENAVDENALYARANHVGRQLFPELALDERRDKLDSIISRLQQDIDLQGRIRDEMVSEYNNNLATDNEKRKIQARIANVDEKMQALSALTILYCSGLKHCCAQIEADDKQ